MCGLRVAVVQTAPTPARCITTLETGEKLSICVLQGASCTVAWWRETSVAFFPFRSSEL